MSSQHVRLAVSPYKEFFCIGCFEWRREQANGGGRRRMAAVPELAKPMVKTFCTINVIHRTEHEAPLYQLNLSVAS